MKEDNMASLKEKTTQGLFWGAVNSGATQILNLFFGIFLARLLSPADYGIVGMLAIFTAIAGNIQSSGFSTALINIKEPTHQDYNAVFWFNTLTSITLYIILFFSAPFIAHFFHQPCLVKLSRFIFLSLVISAIGIAPITYLNKNLCVKENTIIGVISLLASGITGIILAWNGMAYWSIAWQQMVYISVSCIGRFYYVRWAPTLPIDFTPLKKLFSFSIKILFTNIANTINSNILTVILGRLFPVKSVGNYTQANKWTTMGYSFVANTVGQITHPVFASIADEKEREQKVLRKIIRFTSFLSFPIMFGIAMVAKEFIVITLSEKWIDSVVLLQILCIGGAFMPFYTIYQNLMMGHGRSDIYMWCNFFQIACQLCIMLIIHSYGIIWMITAFCTFSILWLGVWQYYAQKIAHVSFIQTMMDVCPFMIIASITTGGAYLLTISISNIYILFISRITIAIALYFLIMKLTHAVIFEECMQFIFHKFKRSKV